MDKKEKKESHVPLPEQSRPQSLAGVVGQDHLVGKGQPLYLAVTQKHLFSFILWGPPGTGKTTIARIYGKALGADFYERSAVSASKADIKKIIDTESDKQKVLFLDEIHRFNKAQQDYLLPHVESGEIILIGATTENPSFEVIGALLSRCRVFTLKTLSVDSLAGIIKQIDISISEKTSVLIADIANGDARQALSIYSSVKELNTEVTEETIKKTFKDRKIRYDKKGEEHYNTISAFIKSMRAGNSDAALYYLAVMIEVGEDPLFIARRMIIFASEDIGLAQPTALVVANAVFDAVHKIGLPEARINLAHGVAYLASATKDRSAYEAINQAQADVKKYGNLEIPLKIRNAETELMKDIGYGAGYEKYDPEGMMPEKLKDRHYFKPPSKRH